MPMTEWVGEYEGIVDVNKWPRDADDSQTAGRHDIGVDETSFQIVAQQWG